MNGMLKGLLSEAVSDNNVEISMSSYQAKYGTFYDAYKLNSNHFYLHFYSCESILLVRLTISKLLYFGLIIDDSLFI